MRASKNIWRISKMKFGKASRTISVLFALILIISLIAGCSQTSDNTQQTTTRSTTATTTRTTTQGQTTTQTETEPEAPEFDPFGKYDPVLTIKVAKEIDPFTIFDTSDPNKESLESNVWTKAYEEHLGIKFDYVLVAPSDQYVTRWNLAIASRNIPEMGLVPYQIFSQLIEADMLEEMGQYFEDYVSPRYEKASIDDGRLTLNYNMHNGKVMGLPVVGVQYDDMSLMFTRKDWADNVGLGIPTTIDEFYQLAKAFKENDPNKTGSADTLGFAIGNGAGAICDIRGIFNAHGAYIETWSLNSNNELVWGSVQPEAKEALLFLQKLYQEGIIPEDFAVKNPNVVASEISANTAGLTFGNFAAPLLNINDSHVSDPDANWVVSSIPSLTGITAKPQASASPFAAFVVMKGFEHPEAAVKLLNLDLQLLIDEPELYSGVSGFAFHKYRISRELSPPWRNANTQLAIVEAFKTGDDSHLDARDKGLKATIERGRKGERDAFGMMLVFDVEGTFDHINRMLDEERYMLNPYQAVATQRMTEVAPSLGELVMETYYKIIMGDSIDTFDEMVQTWNSIGGIEITRQANEWYRANQ